MSYIESAFPANVFLFSKQVKDRNLNIFYCTKHTSEI